MFLFVEKCENPNENCSIIAFNPCIRSVHGLGPWDGVGVEACMAVFHSVCFESHTMYNPAHSGP